MHLPFLLLEDFGGELDLEALAFLELEAGCCVEFLRADADFVQHEFGPRVADLTLDVAIDTQAGSLPAAEMTAKDAKTKRFVELRLDGAAFVTPDTALARFIKLQGAYHHAADSLQDRGSDRDGNLVVRMHLQSVYDATGAADVRFIIQNNLATYG